MRNLLLVLALGAGTAAAQPPTEAPPAQAPSAERHRQLDWVLERGRLLFALDRAAWVATDDMQERIKDPQQAGLLGYIVDRDDAGLVAIFYAQEQDRLVAAYRARIGARGVASSEVFKAGERPALTARQQRLARTLEQLRDAAPRLEMCGPSAPNVAIVPPDTPDGPIDLYVMTPQTDTNVLPFGGHHKLTLDKDGRILNQRRFTNTCLAMPLSQAGQPRPVGLGVTHLLDPVPTEIHVFSAMAGKIPVAVAAGGSIWEVTGEAIRFISRLDEE